MFAPQPGFSMRSISASRAQFLRSAGLHPALRSFGAECGAVLLRLLAYVGALAAIAMLALQLYAGLRQDAAPIVEAPPGWRTVLRAPPAFAVSQFDMPGITATYEILRGPDGGRKDILRWGVAADQMAVAGIEIERPGAESKLSDRATAATAGLSHFGIAKVHAAGQIDSKFGLVSLWSLVDGAGQVLPCLGFVKVFAEPRLRLQGWSCEGVTVVARRAAIACTLNRLMLLNAGNDAKLAELFARAELRRPDCNSGTGAAVESADWITGAQNPRLRGAL
jgi:hypothetical protein